MRSDRAPKARKYWAALVFLTLGTAAGVYHNRRVDAGKPDFIAGVVRAVVYIPARALHSASGWFGRQTEWITRGRRLADENRDLRMQVAQLEGENNGLREAQIELDRLRDDIGFVHAVPHRLIAADVIDYKPDAKFDTLGIARGSADGIRKSSVVVTHDGVVGRVYEVELGTAQVLMLTDQKSGVGARIQRASSRVTGICEGDNSTSLTMFGLQDSADVRPGDAVVTSGLGGVYPGGLLIGNVTDVRQDSNNGGKIVKVAPRVQFNRLEQVYVIP